MNVSDCVCHGSATCPIGVPCVLPMNAGKGFSFQWELTGIENTQAGDIFVVLLMLILLLSISALGPKIDRSVDFLHGVVHSSLNSLLSLICMYCLLKNN